MAYYFKSFLFDLKHSSYFKISKVYDIRFLNLETIKSGFVINAYLLKEMT